MAKTVKVLRVVAKRDGFRRAGMEFGAVPTNIPLDTLSQDVLTVLRNDPSLVAFEVNMVIGDDGQLRDAEPGKDGLPTLAQLDARKASLDELGAELMRRAQAQGARDNALQQREQAVADGEAALAAKAADLDAKAAAMADKPATAKK